MTKFEIENKDDGLILVTTYNTLDGEPRSISLASNKTILEHLVAGVKAFTEGELADKDIKFSTDFGDILMGILPDAHAPHVQWASYKELGQFSDDQDDDLIVLLGTDKSNPDHIFVRQATRRSVVDVIENGADENGYIRKILLDGLVVHKDSIGDFEKSVEEAIADLEAQMA